MSSSPEPLKKDNLRAIILISNWFFNNKYVRWFTTSYTVIYGACYFCLILYSIEKDPQKVQVSEVTVAALACAGFVLNAALYDEKLKLADLQFMRERIFWSDDFFTTRERSIKKLGVNISIAAYWLLWIVMLIFHTFLTVAMVPPKIFYNNNWSTFSVIISRVLFSFYSLCGYFLGNMHVCYFGYGILHGYFQMKVLINYLRHEFRKHRELKLLEKISDRKYQKSIQELFLRCVKQHRNLNDYGMRISTIYSRWMVWLCIIATFVFSCTIYSVLTDLSPQSIAIFMFSISYYGLLCLLYMSVGQCFTDTYEDFHLELMKVPWYELNRENRKLYYMLLIFTQKEVGIQLLPSVVISRTVLASFLKIVYGGITLLKSVQN